jgi:hypothetical protein
MKNNVVELGRRPKMIRWFLYVVLFVGLVMSEIHAFGEDGIISVGVDPKSVICKRFMGFGVEWDSNGYNASGITDQDFALIRKRVEWMRLPIVRIMMQSKWCYKGNGWYDWDDPQMKSLYRHLDLCQKLGITVLLTDWGIEQGWLKTPDVSKVEDPKYAEIISTYINYLLNKKHYTCIRYFILVNEPNHQVEDWARWKKGVENVSAAFRKKGLDQKITLMGADCSYSDDWHPNAVDQLQNTLGAYDIHFYAPEEVVRTGALFDWLKTRWAYALTRDPKAKEKPLIVAEAGIMAPGFSTSNNPLHLDPRYGILMADYAVQAANAGSWAVLAWMLDDNSHKGFSWGMWKSKTGGMETKPWFYTWSLLTRCFRPGATIVEAKSTSDDVRVLAAYVDEITSSGEQLWTFCIVNRADAPRTIHLHVTAGPSLKLNRYVYSATSAKANTDGFPIALDNRTYDLGAGADISCEPNSVVVLSSGSEDVHEKSDRHH